MWQTTVLTLFPEMFPGPLAHSLYGKALQKKLWSLQCVNIRDYSHLKHHKVDDKPFGGGCGMVMRPDIVDAAIREAYTSHTNPHLIYLSPRGMPLTQSLAKQWVADPTRGLMLLCGHYEGIDQRVIDHWTQEKNLLEVSIGDYILSGGETAALVIIDTCLRLVKNVIGCEESLHNESFGLGSVALLEYPQYTRPEVWYKMSVPPVLLSGHHAAIQQWRNDMALAETKKRRPELYERIK